MTNLTEQKDRCKASCTCTNCKCGSDCRCGSKRWRRDAEAEYFGPI